MIRITQITFEFVNNALLSESSKRQKFFTLIFILKCLSKASVIYSMLKSLMIKVICLIDDSFVSSLVS